MRDTKEARTALHKRANSITKTLIELAIEGHCVGNSNEYSRLFREYKTIERTIKQLEGY